MLLGRVIDIRFSVWIMALLEWFRTRALMASDANERVSDWNCFDDGREGQESYPMIVKEES